MYILDTDFLFAYFFRSQSTHLQAVKIMNKIENEELYISNLVLQELATVLSNKEGQQKAKIALANCKLLDCKIIKLTDADEEQVWQMFESIDKNSTSFIDCINFYLAQTFNYKIVSFDKFYPVEMLDE